MDRLQDTCWRHAVGLIDTEDLPMAAAHALADGDDCPSLRALAGLSRRGDLHEMRDLFARAFVELKRAAPARASAERYLLHHLAAELSCGRMTPKRCVAYASRIDHHIKGAPEEEDFLRVVSSYADYLEEYAPEAFRDWTTELLAAARRLAALGGPSGSADVPAAADPHTIPAGDD